MTKMWKITTTVKYHHEWSASNVTLDIAVIGDSRGLARANAIMFLRDECDSDIPYTHRMSIKRTDYTPKFRYYEYWEDCPICHHPTVSTACPHTETEIQAAYEEDVP